MEALQQTELWDFLARATKLFDWTAVGSVLVFLTLLQAVWLGSASNRRIDEQQSVMISYVRGLLVRLSIIQKITSSSLESGIDLQGLDASDLLEDLRKNVDRIDPLALPTSACMEAVYQSRNAIETLRMVFGPKDDHYPIMLAMLPTASQYTTYSMEKLRRELEDRSPNLFRRLLHRLNRKPLPLLPVSVFANKLEASAG